MNQQAPEQTEKNPVGRPCEYTQEKADEICALIAQGYSVRSICLMDEFPALSTFYRWIRTEEDFQKQYARAKEDQMDFYAEEIIDISDDGSNDWMEVRSKKGEIEIVLDKEHVMRSKLRTESRKWLMGKLKPKKYGDGTTIRSQLLDKGGDPTDPQAPIALDSVLEAAMKAAQKVMNGENPA